MTRRGGPSAKYVAIVVVFFLCLYGFYCFHNVYTRLKNAEEKTTRLGQQHDSVSAQLQGMVSSCIFRLTRIFGLVCGRIVVS